MRKLLFACLFAASPIWGATDYLLDLYGFETVTNAALFVGTGTKVGEVLPPTEGSGVDAHGNQWGSMYHDVDGDLGTANRLYYWYFTYKWDNEAGNKIDDGAVLFAYSDDYGETWTKPNLGLVSYGGDSNNNILWMTYEDSVWSGNYLLGGVIVRPDEDAPYKWVLSNAAWPSYNIFVYESSDPYFQSDVALLKSGYFWDHPESGGTYDGKAYIFMQDSTGSPARFAVAEILTSLASDSWEVERVSNRAVYGGQNCVTSATTIDSPEDQNHGGTFVTDYDDLWGRISLISPQAAGDNIWWIGELCSLRGYEDGVFEPTDVVRAGDSSLYPVPVGTPYSWDAWPLGENYDSGAFDGGNVNFISNGRITLSDGNDRYFYTGFKPTQDQELNDPAFDYEVQDRRSLGAIDFEPNRISCLAASGGEGVVVSKAIRHYGNGLTFNYDGPIQVELLDLNDSVITGYDKDSCDLTDTDDTDASVTWSSGANDASELTEFKVKIYLSSGKVYAYDVDGAPYGTDMTVTGQFSISGGISLQ